MTSDEVAMSITPREREVIECLAEGLSRKMVADKLHMAQSTVASHVNSLLKKTKCNSIGHLLITLIRLDVIT